MRLSGLIYQSLSTSLPESLPDFLAGVKGVRKENPRSRARAEISRAGIQKRAGWTHELSATPNCGPGTVLTQDGQDDQGQDNEAYAGEPGDVEGFAEEFGKGHVALPVWGESGSCSKSFPV